MTKRGGVTRLRCLAARRYPDVSLQIVLGSDTSPLSWQYSLSFTQDNRQRPYLRSERVLRDGVVLLTRLMMRTSGILKDLVRHIWSRSTLINNFAE